MHWTLTHGVRLEHLGLLPLMLDENDPAPAREQFDKNYQHGGGWQPMPKFFLNTTTMVLTYPGDPPMRPIAVTTLRKEVIAVYPYSFVCIVQPDDSFEVARMD